MAPVIGLAAGTNIISIPCMPPGYTSFDLLSYLGSSDEAASIQRFDRKRGAFATTAYSGGQPSGARFNIIGGEAYIIHMKASKDIAALLAAPKVTITAPTDGATVSSFSTDVSGTITDSSAAVMVNGIVATVINGTFMVTGVPLSEGPNIIKAARGICPAPDPDKIRTALANRLAQNIGLPVEDLIRTGAGNRVALVIINAKIQIPLVDAGGQHHIDALAG